MGECGCSSTDVMFRIPGPEGVHYGIEIYGSCHYCHTPAGVVVHRFNDEWAKDWLTEHVPDAPFISYSSGDPINAMLSIPIVDPTELAAAHEEIRLEDGDGDADRLSEQSARYLLTRAVWRTLNAWHRLGAGERDGDDS